jgi:hypothetical protein
MPNCHILPLNSVQLFSRAETLTFHGTKKNVPQNEKEHLFGGWFVILQPGRAQLNARIVKVFCEGCDVRRVVLVRYAAQLDASDVTAFAKARR